MTEQELLEIRKHLFSQLGYVTEHADDKEITIKYIMDLWTYICTVHGENFSVEVTV